MNGLFLPPANEVCGKVIFSQVSVCPQGGVPVQGRMMLLPVHMPGHMFLLVRSLSLVPYSLRGSLSIGGLCLGVSVQERFLSSGEERGLCKDILGTPAE